MSSPFEPYSRVKESILDAVRRSREQDERCERCYGDVRGECIRAGRCIFGLSQKCIQIGDRS